MAVDLSKLEDAMVQRFRREIERSLARIAAFIRDALRRAKVDDGVLAKEAHNLALAAAIGRELTRLLPAMASQAAARFRREAAALLRILAREMKAQGIDDRFTRQTVASIVAQVGGAVDQIANIAKGGADEMRAVLTEAMRSNVPRDDLMAALQAKLGLTQGQILSVVDTGLMAIDREVVVTQAESAGFRWFLYDGPQDKITRPYCAARIGFVFHASEMDETQNDTGPQPPSQFGGGWNCRHRWVALSLDDAKRYRRWQARGWEEPAAAAVGPQPRQRRTLAVRAAA